MLSRSAPERLPTVDDLMQHAKQRLVRAHASAAPSKEELFRDVKSRFDACTTEDDFLQVLKGALSAAGKQPLFNIFHDFYNNYKGTSTPRDFG